MMPRRNKHRSAPHSATETHVSLQHAKDDSFLARWLPHPLLSCLLVMLWMALLNSFTVAGWVGAVVLGIAIPIYTANFWPARPMIRSPLKAIAFIAIVMWDVLVANVHVAYLILFRPVAQLRTRWVTVPLDLKTPEAITVLAGTITLTPGTVSSDISADGRAILIHCLDVDDEQALVDTIKNRYEARLKAIFP